MTEAPIPRGEPPVPTPPPDRYVGWLNAVKGLTISNVLVIALLVMIAVPVYVIWKALGDDNLMDRLLSTYEEVEGPNAGCTIRHAQERAGPDLWSIGSGFAFFGEARWFVNVTLSHKPTDEEVASYCESLKLIADRMLENGGGGSEIQRRSMPRPAPDGSGHDGDMPAESEAPEKAE